MKFSFSLEQKPVRPGVPLLLAFLVGGAAAPAYPLECDPSYPDYCIPPPPPDLDCKDVEGDKPFRVKGEDPHKFDRDRDGWACEG